MIAPLSVTTRLVEVTLIVRSRLAPNATGPLNTRSVAPPMKASAEYAPLSVTRAPPAPIAAVATVPAKAIGLLSVRMDRRVATPAASG